MATISKALRQEQILRVIRAHAVHTQEELAHYLQEQGVPATQVTLSRDIREMGLVKTAEGYRPLRDAAARSLPDIHLLLRQFLLETRVAQNLVVLKTAPGQANAVAVALDEVDWPEVVGTVAGDDTIFVAAPDAAAALVLKGKLGELGR